MEPNKDSYDYKAGYLAGLEKGIESFKVLEKIHNDYRAEVKAIFV